MMNNVYFYVSRGANIQSWPTPIMFVGGGTGSGVSNNFERDTEQGGLTIDTETGDNITVTDA